MTQHMNSLYYIYSYSHLIYFFYFFIKQILISGGLMEG
jgi:hypothetical protein